MPQLNNAKFILRLLDSFKANEGKIAVVDHNGQRQTTYKELFTNACRVAGYLQQKQYPSHSFIGICLPTSMEYMASEIGIWLAGHAIVPMGDKYPQDRIDYIMHHCESPLLINDDVIKAMMKTEPTDNYVLPDEDDVNALFYTSGSTGTPKAVIDTFSSFRIPPSDESIIDKENITVMGITAPMYFVACKQLYTILLKGGIANIIPAEIIKDIRLLETYLEKQQIEFVFIPPTALAFFHNKSSHLKVVIAASERLSGISSSDFKIYNRYGQTETGGAIFSFFVDKEYDNTPIGRPDADVEYCILDTDGKPVAQGEEGELCVRGPFTAGYYKEPELTDNLYRGGWLHTGDIVYQQTDGNVVYVNRKDWMVKINGQRVEPGEVEAVIKQVDGIENAIVKGFSTKNSQFLCAYYIAKDNVSEDTIREYLCSKLPAYMVPAYFVRMDSFPLLPNGKTDRKSLLAPVNKTEDNVRSPYSEPTNNTERQLCVAFEKTLSVDHVGIDDDFFELGGDSIRVMEVQTLCPQLALSSQMIYANRTPKKIAEVCARTKQVSFVQRKDYPLSQTQLGIYVECMSQQGSTLYNNAILFKLADDIDINKLARACEAVVEAHPYIKTRLFVDEEGHPRQRRYDEDVYHQQVENMTETEFVKMKSQLEQPFHLLNDRLFRIRILKTNQSVYLFIDFHHIIFDGTSMQILLQDISAAYEAKALNKETWSGFEVAQEEEDLRLTDDYSKAAEWNKTEFGALDVTSLPIPDNNSEQVSIGKYTYMVPVDRKILEQSSQRLGVTAQVLTTAVFGYLLGLFTHSREALFATVYNGRNHLKTQRTIAMLVKTIAVHTSWNENLTIGEWLQQVKETLLGSMNHDLFSFAELCALNSHVNSDVLFVYQGGFQTSLTIDGHISSPQSLTKNATGKCLFMEVLPEEQQLHIEIAYQENRYSEFFIRQIAHCYEQIFRQLIAVSDEKVRLIDIPFLTAIEYDQLTAIGAGQQLLFDKTETLVSLFRKKAKEVPAAPALVFKDKCYSYQELDTITNRLAAFLANHYQVKSEDTVGVMIDRSDLMVIYPLAIMKMGAAYMPLDYQFPATRLQYMCEDAGVRLILSEGNRVGNAMPDFQGEVWTDVQLKDLPEITAELSLPNPEQHYVVLYTSGSTGLPKGVALEHHSMVNFCHWYSKEIGLRTDDHVMAYANFGFDCHMLDLFPALTTGACVYVIPSDMRLDLPMLNNYMEEQGITVAFMTTQVGHLFATTIENHSLRVLTVAGEKLMPMTTPSSYSLYNGYGPTECTVFTSYYRLEGDYHRPIIGRPLPNYQLYVVNSDLQPVPQGAVGELIVLGEGVARGYLHPADKDRDKFTMFKEQRCYKTGDLVRWTDSGDLEYLGRMDNQVKLRGLRIELEEIELRALQHPLISQAIARVVEVSGVENLCLYYVPKEAGVSIDVDELKSFLSEKLVAFMVPTVMMQLDSIPMTPNGKINRKALPVPTMTSETKDAPETEMEKHVLEVISEMLKTTQIGVTDNLLYWGLSSLAAMRLSALLQHRFKVYVKMVEVMKNPTVRGIASLLSKASDYSLPVYEQRDTYPLMENQRGLYFEWKKNPDTTQYNIPQVFSFEGIDANRMVEALRETVDAHPYLKSKLIEVDGDVVLQRNDESPVEIKISKLCEEPDKDYFQKRVLPFHLLRDQLYRIEVLKAPQKTYLFFDVHHIIFDGLSIDVFMKDLRRAYDGQQLSKESVQAFDYMLYEESHKDNERMKYAERQIDLMLADAHVLSSPNSSKPDGVSNAMLEISIPRQDIDAFCSKCQVTTNSYMHAAFATAMQRISGEQRPLYLTVDNGREVRAELLQCIGMFVKTLPFVNTCDEASDLSTIAYVQKTQQLLQESYRRAYYPLSSIVERHQIHPEVMFAYQGGLQKGKTFNQMEQVSLELDKAKFPLSFVVNDEENAYSFVLEYDGLRYNRQQMQLLLSAVCMAARHLAIADTVSQVELVSEDDKLSLLTLGTGLNLDYNRSQTFVSLFKEQVSHNPDAIAVVDAHSHITYQELDRRSDILAVRLKAFGVTNGSFVSVMLPRTKEFLVAVMSVFKAGGAYVPLDSDIPEERLHFMVKDSQTTALITTRDWLPKTQSFQDIPFLLIEDVDWTAPSVAIDDSSSTSLAYMIYTSGSTGEPKGVTVTHEAMMNFIIWLKDTEELKAGEQCAIHTNFVFDGSLFDLYPPLISGATLHILSSSLRMDLHGMYRYFIDHHIVGLLLTTQMGMMMMSNYELPLRFLMVGGEKLTGFHIPPSMKLYNCYGPTEFTVCSAFHQVDSLRTYDNIPIGRPVPNTMSAVVDSRGHLLPRGLIGELCLIGRQIAQGYWNRHELTEESFTDCPFISGEKMYHTRDLVRWNEEGELEYLGRMDSQFKIRGYRIELGEIEKKIVEYPGVTSAAVIVHQEQTAQSLIGYFTSKKTINPEIIQEHLRRLLPEYMTPQFLVHLSSMPMTINGKINRKELIDRYKLPLKSNKESIAPKTNDEKVLYDLTKKVLKIDDFGVTDDLTLLGMTSLSAIRLADLANREGLNIKVNDILKNKSIRDILVNEQSIGKWENGFDAKKPIIVLIQGFTYYQQLEMLISMLRKHYSVFIIEPINDHFEALINKDKRSCQDVVKTYLDYLEACLPPNTSVEMFIGHSFGGELAYRCAVSWYQKTNTMPSICLLDTFAHVANIVKEMPIPDVKELTPDNEPDLEEFKEWKRHIQQILSLKDNDDLPSYEGNVLYFDAEDLSAPLKTIHIDVQELDKKKKEDLNNWKALAPHMSIHSVAAGHFTMLEEQFCKDYIESIDNIVLPKNS